MTFTRQATRYGPDHKPFVEAIFNRDAGLKVVISDRVRACHPSEKHPSVKVLERGRFSQFGALLEMSFDR